MVVEAVRPHRSDGHGEAWRLLAAHHDEIEGVGRRRLDGGEDPRAAGAPRCRGAVAHGAALCARECAAAAAGGVRRCGSRTASRATSCRSTSVAWASSSTAGRRRVVWALIFTACYSRHCFVWLTHRQTIDDVIDGFEAAWGFFGGVFRTVIPDNLKAIVDRRRSARATVEPGVRRVRPGPRVPCRPGPGAPPAGQATGRADGAVRAQLDVGRRDVRRLGRRATPGRAVVRGNGPGSGSTARPSAAPPSCSRWRSCRGCCRRRTGVTTCRSTPRRRSTATTTSRSPRRSTRCPAT